MTVVLYFRNQFLVQLKKHIVVLKLTNESQTNNNKSIDTPSYGKDSRL